MIHDPNSGVSYNEFKEMSNSEKIECVMSYKMILEEKEEYYKEQKKKFKKGGR